MYPLSPSKEELFQGELNQAMASGNDKKYTLLLKLKEKMLDILYNRFEAEIVFETSKHLQDPVYLESVKAGNLEVTKKVINRSLNRKDYVALANKYDIDLGIDYYYIGDRVVETLWNGEGYRIIKVGDKQGIQDMDGNEIVEAKYDEIKKFMIDLLQ